MKFFHPVVVLLVASDVTAERHITAHEIILEGNSTFLEDFEGVEKILTADGQCSLVHLKLDNVRVRRSVLANFLTNCTDLETLILKKVNWEWKTETDFEKIQLPSLIYFEFEQIEDPQYIGNVRETLESVIFFYKNERTGTGLVAVLQNLKFAISCSTSQHGSFELSTFDLVVKNIKDDASLRLLYGITTKVETFGASYCTIDVTSLDLASVKYLYLHYNDIGGGTISQVIKSAVVVEILSIYSKVPEAIDGALLPAKSLSSISTRSLSFRYNSVPPHLRHFPKPWKIEVEFGDVDLGVFNLSELILLQLRNAYLWNTSLDDILKSHELNELKHLTIDCQHLDEECPVIDVGSPGLRSLREIELQFVDVRVKMVPVTPLPHIDSLTVTLMMCKIDYFVLDNIGSIFPHVREFKMSMADVLSGSLLSKLAKLRPNYIMIKTPMYGAAAKVKVQFKAIIKTVLNATFPDDILETELVLWFNFNGVDGYEFHGYSRSFLPRKEYRITMHLNLHGFSRREITSTLLSQIYNTYITFVYCICGTGLICNCLSFVVLMRKTMRSSTGILLLGLTCCDSMYLITSFVSTEEFSNLFQEYFRRSNLNGFVAYPINKTMYTASIYMTVLITVERFVAITKPLCVSSIFTIRRARRYTLLVFGFATFLNLPRWLEFVKWSYEASSPEWSSNFPRQLHRFPLYQIIYQQLLWYLCIYFIPFVTIVTLNILIIKAVTKAARERRLTATTQSSASDSSLTRMLLSVVFVFILLNSLAAALELNFILKGVEPEVTATIVCLPIILNSAVNFVLYCILGSKFRAELKLLLRELGTWIRTRCTRRRISRSNSIELTQRGVGQ